MYDWQGASYERVFKPLPVHAHLLTPHHQAHLTSLAEDSEEGSDAVSESEGGLIQDDDSPTEASPAASASLEHSQGSKMIRSGVIAATGQAVGQQPSAAGTDGMFELDMNDDSEQASGVNSFTAKGGHRLSQHAATTSAGVDQEFDRPATTVKEEQQAAGLSTVHASAVTGDDHAADGSSADALQPNSSSAGQFDKPGQLSQQSTASGQQPLLDSIPLSPVPTLGQEAAAAAHPAGSQGQGSRAAADTLAGIDLEEVELEDAAGTALPCDRGGAGQAATDEWEEVNLARAKELAVDAPTAAIPGDKVGPKGPGVLLLCRVEL